MEPWKNEFVIPTFAAKWYEFSTWFRRGKGRARGYARTSKRRARGLLRSSKDGAQEQNQTTPMLER